MRAGIREQYGPPHVVHLAEVTRPVPAAGDVLRRVRVASVKRAGCAHRSGWPLLTRVFSSPRPRARVLRSELAESVEAYRYRERGPKVGTVLGRVAEGE